MDISSAGISIVKAPWTSQLDELVHSVDSELTLVCPFVKRFGTERVIEQLQRRGITASVSVRLITDVRPDSALMGSLDLDAIADLGRIIPKFELIYLPSVHAKVYIADTHRAIITSGNLTRPGICGNIEYGMAITGESSVREIRSDCEAFAILGSVISTEDISILARELRDVKDLFLQAQRSVRQEARQAFNAKLRATNLKLYKQRARGKTTHGIFSDTICILLRRGPLRTVDLHSLIQFMHPDLCDNSIDRVIGDVHFGKRWKHYVRNAQQSLKRQSKINYKDGLWSLEKS